MTKSTITRERLQELAAGQSGFNLLTATYEESQELARMALAAMDQKPALHRYRRKAVEPYGPYPWNYEVFVDYPQPFEDIEDEYFYAAPPVVTGFAVDGESERLPLDYLQGHKDGLEWAAQLAEANHPEAGDWLYDDPIELAKAIRKGPDMPPAQPVADSEPVIVVGDDGGDALSYRRLIQSFEPGTKLYRHAQPDTSHLSRICAECTHVWYHGKKYNGKKRSNCLRCGKVEYQLEGNLAAPEVECQHEWVAYGMSKDKVTGVFATLFRCRLCGLRSRAGVIEPLQEVQQEIKS